MSCEVEKGKGESSGCVDNLRMQIKDSGGIAERLSRMATEMTAAQGEILGQVGEMEIALRREKLKSEELEKEVVLLRRQVEEMQNLERELLEKDAVVERLKVELAHTKDLNICCEKIASETIAELKKTKEEVELQESKNWDQCRYIGLLETELKQLMGDGGRARDEVAALNHNIGKMKAELEEMRTEAAHSKDRVLEAQVENALLKVELHKWRSKAAAAEAAEERSKREKFALNRALHLAAQQENRKLLQPEESNNNDHKVMEQRVAELERELMAATRKMREFRTRAEQAISRAEAAEKARAEAEMKRKRRKEEERKKKDFFKELHKELSSREAAGTDFEVKNTPAIQTLSNVLEIPL